MAKAILPPQAVLEQLLNYDPATGDLTWKPRPKHNRHGGHFQDAGKPALASVGKNGYRNGHILHQRAYAHRVIWKLVHGADPDTIDHINGDKLDNRVENLRSISAVENQRNVKLGRLNKSGKPGVMFHAARGKWYAQIRDDEGRKRFLGYHETLEAAILAREAAEIEMGYHPNHGRRSGL